MTTQKKPNEILKFESLADQMPHFATLTSLASGDLLWVYDVSAQRVKCIAASNLASTNTFTFDGSTGNNKVVIPDNLAQALLFVEASNAYITICTTNSGEKITLHKAIEMATTLTFTGATGVNKILVQDNLAQALIIGEGANAYITICTTNSAEAISIAKATTFSAAVTLSSTVSHAGALTNTVGAATAAVALRLGLTATEGTEIKVIDEDVTLTNAVEVNLTQTVPAGAVILSVQANLDTLIVGDGTGDDGLVKVGIGTTADPDKYGKTSALTQNLKVDTIPDWTVLSGAEQICVKGCDAAGAAVTEKFVADGVVRVRVVYLTLNSLDDTA